MDTTESSNTANDRPGSFAEHFSARAEDGASTSDPAGQTPDSASASAAATSQPESTVPPEATQVTDPAPPQDRWPTILENARQKAIADKQAEWDQQYGWAKQVDQRAVMEASRLGQLYHTDKSAFVREMIGTGELPPDLVSEFARVLGSRRGQGRETAETDLEPDVPLLDANGQPTGIATYSAPKVKALMDHAVQQAIAEVTKTIAPLQETHTAWQAERRTEARKTFAKDLTTDIRQQPHFAEHESAIKAEFAKAQLRNPDDQTEVAAALDRAYLKVLTSVVLPGYKQQAASETVTSLKQKAVAGQAAVNPSRPAPSNGQRPRSFAELYESRRGSR